MGSDIIVFETSGGAVAFDPESKMWNLNAMHQASGANRHKAPAEWLRGTQAKELIAVLSAEETTGNSRSLVEAREGRNGGTWACIDLAIIYAHYLHPQFYVQWNRLAFARRTRRRPRTIAPDSARARALAFADQCYAEGRSFTCAELAAALGIRHGAADTHFHAIPQVQPGRWDAATRKTPGRRGRPPLALHPRLTQLPA